MGMGNDRELVMPMVGQDSSGAQIRLSNALHVSASDDGGGLRLTLDLRPFPPRDRAVIANRFSETLARAGSPDMLRHAHTGLRAALARNHSADTSSFLVCAPLTSRLLNSNARLRYAKHLLGILAGAGFRMRIFPLLDWAVYPDVPESGATTWQLAANSEALLRFLVGTYQTGADSRPLRDRPGLAALLARQPL